MGLINCTALFIFDIIWGIIMKVACDTTIFIKMHANINNLSGHELS